MDYKTLGQNIRRLRVTQGFRQEDLAEKCECSASHIGQIENGRVKPSLEIVTKENIDKVIIEGGFHRRDEVYLNADYS